MVGIVDDVQMDLIKVLERRLKATVGLLRDGLDVLKRVKDLEEIVKMIR